MDSRRSIISTPSDVRPAYLRLFGGLFVTGLLLVIILGNFFSRWSPDPRCADLLAISDQDVAIPLPPNCIETSEATPDPLVKYLDNERERRGLVFKKWIICKLSGAASKPALDFQQDQRWLPSYEPLTYQFRRTVVILPCGQSALGESPVAAQVCSIPKQKYAAQIAGQCDGKFALWK
jgi:hypothetical protein